MSAYVLALDTATERTVVALGTRNGDAHTTVASAEIDAPRAALGRLLPVLADMLTDLQLTAGDIGEIVVGRGPGSFTGVRIGVATAKGLAHGLGVPLLGVGTLDAIAWRCARDHEGLLGVVGDAMRGEVYPALFELSGGMARRFAPDRVVKPAVAAAEWAALDEPLMLAGNGLIKHEEAFCAGLGDRSRAVARELWLPTGDGLLGAYAHAREAGEAGTGHPGALLPIYTRLSDAEEDERARGEGPR